MIFELVQESPVILGILVSIAIGLPAGLSIVWEMREQDNKEVDKDPSVWDSEWDIEEEE